MSGARPVKRRLLWGRLLLSAFAVTDGWDAPGRVSDTSSARPARRRNGLLLSRHTPPPIRVVQGVRSSCWAIFALIFAMPRSVDSAALRPRYGSGSLVTGRIVAAGKRHVRAVPHSPARYAGAGRYPRDRLRPGPLSGALNDDGRAPGHAGSVAIRDGAVARLTKVEQSAVAIRARLEGTHRCRPPVHGLTWDIPGRRRVDPTR
jgi:hypothetical protein